MISKPGIGIGIGFVFLLFFSLGEVPPKREKNEKNKANANANAWFLFQVLFPGSYSGGRILSRGGDPPVKLIWFEEESFPRVNRPHLQFVSKQRFLRFSFDICLN